jgi:DNA-binding winged helix-turn-helix (wHTH) protein/TolB-like protein
MCLSQDNPDPVPVARFGPYQADFRTRALRKHGIPVHIQETPLRLLEILLEKSGEPVSREQLRERLWPVQSTADLDRNLNSAVNKLRSTLNDLAEHPRYIETVPRQGYRYVGPAVERDPIESPRAGEAAAASAPEPAKRNGGNGSNGDVLRFGAFELQAKSGELRKEGAQVRLRPQPFRLLALLASRPGEVVTREEICREVWSEDTFVDFNQGLNHCILEIRRALEDEAEASQYVRTIPGRGYEFLAQPIEGGQAKAEATPEETDAAATVPPQEISRWSWATYLLAVAAVVAIVLVAANVGTVRDWFTGGGGAPRIRSIAVLPLENLSNDPEQDFFADGMTEELITTLSRISALRVISRQSTLRFRGSDEPLPKIARALNVDAIVGGTVQRSGNRVRITAHLLHGKSDEHLWATYYERDFQDILRLQSELAQSIAREVSAAVTPLLPRPVQISPPAKGAAISLE